MDAQVNKLPGKLRETFHPVVREAIFDGNVAPFGIAELLEPFAKCP
jgi:hypothetical protein